MLLRISENLLLRLSEKKNDPSLKLALEPTTLSKKLRELTVIFLKNAYCVTSAHVLAIEQVIFRHVVERERKGNRKMEGKYGRELFFKKKKTFWVVSLGYQ
jgi:stalled ribosome alternative rescue factor ArfA